MNMFTFVIFSINFGDTQICVKKYCGKIIDQGQSKQSDWSGHARCKKYVQYSLQLSNMRRDLGKGTL